MHADAAKLIWDAQQALHRIRRFVANKDFAAYQSDELLRSAVERQFEILGEALNQLSRLDPNMAEKIPDLPRIVAFRNAYSRPSLPLIPAQSCHPFQTKAATDSKAKLPPWQVVLEQVLEPPDTG